MVSIVTTEGKDLQEGLIPVSLRGVTVVTKFYTLRGEKGMREKEEKLVEIKYHECPYRVICEVCPVCDDPNCDLNK